MNALSLATPTLEGAFCSAHPDRRAAATCARCGSFTCAEDQRVLLEKPYCQACAARPEVDYLEATRLRYWGKRDTWTWLVGFGVLVNLISGTYLFGAGAPLRALGLLIIGALGACFFFGVRWARVAYFAVASVFTLISLASGGAQGSTAFDQGMATGRIIGALGMMAVVVAIYFDTRNRLFFRIDVPREKLEKLWNTYQNNPIARAGFMLSLLAIFVPGMALLTLPLCIVGLTRVNPSGHPPIGRKGQAIAGIVLSGLELIGWAAVLVSSWRS